MSVIAKFIGDFSSFNDAVKQSELKLKSFEEGAHKVGPALNKMVDSFSGKKLIQDAQLSAEAVERIGGASKLTSAEQARLNVVVTEALAKYKALGVEAPASLTKISGELNKNEVSFKQVAVAAAAVSAVIAGVSAVLGKLGEHGADVNDVRDSFKQLTSAVGESSDEMLGNLRKATLGVISDFDLMKTVNLSMSQGLKLTSAEFGTLGDVAAVLADRTGTDLKSAFDTLSQAMATGQDRTLKTIGLNIDAKAATEAYAASIGKKVAELTEDEKKQAISNAILEEGRKILGASGKAQEDFADKVGQSRVHITNFVDAISSWVATSPAIGNWTSIITAVSGSVAGIGIAIGPVTTALGKLMPTLGLAGGAGGFGGLGASVAKAGALLGPFVIPVAAVAAGLTALYLTLKHFGLIEPIIKAFKDLGAVLQQAAANAFTVIVDKLKLAVTWFADLGKVLGGQLLTVLNNIKTAVTDLANGAFGQLIVMLGKIAWAVLVQQVTVTWTVIKTLSGWVMDLTKWVGELVMKAANWIASFSSVSKEAGVLDKAVTALNAGAKFIIDTFSDLKEILVAVADSGFGKLVLAIAKLGFAALMAEVRTLWADLQTLGSVLWDLAGEAFQAVILKVQDVWTRLGDLWDMVRTGIKWIGDLDARFTAWVQSFSLVKNASVAVQGVMDALWKKMAEVVTWAGKLVDGWTKVLNTVGLGKQKFPEVTSAMLGLKDRGIEPVVAATVKLDEGARKAAGATKELADRSTSGAKAHGAAATAVKGHGDAVAALVAKLGGSEAIKAADLWIQALPKIGGLSKLTAADTKALHAVVGEALAAYARMGKEPPLALQQLRDAMVPTMQASLLLANTISAGPTSIVGALTKLGLDVIPSTAMSLTTLTSTLDKFGVTTTTQAVPAIKASGAAMEAGVKATGGYIDSLGDLADAFVAMAQVSGDSMTTVAKNFATIITSMEAAKVSTMTLGRGLTDLGKGELTKGLAGITTGAIGIFNSFQQATSSTSTFANALGGAAVGMQVGGVWGAAIGGAIGLIKSFAKTSEETAKVSPLRDLFFQMAGGLETLNPKVVALTGNLKLVDAVFKAKTVDQYNAAIKELGDLFKKVDDAAAKFGLTWRDLGETAKNAQVAATAKEITAAFELLIKAGYDEQAVLKGMSKDMNQFLIDAVAAGKGIPPAMKPMLDQMIKMGFVTDEAAAAMLGLRDDSVPSLKAITDAANRYGLKLSELGPKVAQLKINETAAQIIKDFELLMKAGANAGTVITAMGTQIQEMVTQALKAGSTIPEGMKPLLQAMLEAGTLVDENEQKLHDLSRFNFAKPLEKMVDDLIRKLDDLIDKFNELLKVAGSVPKAPTATSTGTTTTAPKLTIPKISPVVLPDFGLLPMAKGGRGMVKKPTLFLAGEEGPEEFAFSGSGKRFGGSSRKATSGIVQEIHVHMDAREVAYAMAKDLPDVIDLTVGR